MVEQNWPRAEEVEHETLVKERDKLRSEICAAVSQWEERTGVYVTKINYFKSKRMFQCRIELSLELAKGETW